MNESIKLVVAQQIPLPLQLQNLVAWYKADNGPCKDAACTIPVSSNNDSVLGWKDTSGNFNNLSQNIGGGATWIQFAKSVNGLTMPGVRMTNAGGQALYTTAGTLNAATTSCTVVTVFGTNADTGYEGLVVGSNARWDTGYPGIRVTNSASNSNEIDVSLNGVTQSVGNTTANKNSLWAFQMTTTGSPAQPNTKAFVTSGTTWSAVTDGSPIVVECIGGGGSATGTLKGGGGGEYRKSTLTYASGTVISISIGQGGSGGSGADGTNTVFGSNVVVAVGGKAGSSGGTGGTGGTGDVGFNGGDGNTGSALGLGGSGGGGAGGPNGVGATGGSESATGAKGGAGGGGNGGGTAGAGMSFAQTTGADGGNNSTGSGHGVGDTTGGGATAGTNGGGGGGGTSQVSGGPTNGAIGGTGTEFDATHGSGGGGGGGGGSSTVSAGHGGNGGLYGGGAGAPGFRSGGGFATGGSGANGIIVISYNAASTYSTTSTFYKDTVSSTTTGTTNGLFAMNGFVVNVDRNQSAPNGFGNNTYYEILLYNRLLNSSEMTTLFSYLGSKWGLPSA